MSCARAMQTHYRRSAWASLNRAKTMCGLARRAKRLIDAYAVAVRILRVVQRCVGSGEQLMEREDVRALVAIGDADAEGRLVIEVGDRVREVDGHERLP